MLSQSLKLGSSKALVLEITVNVSSLSSINTGEPAYLQGKLWQYTASVLIYFPFRGQICNELAQIFSKICDVCMLTVQQTKRSITNLCLCFLVGLSKFTIIEN